MDHLRKKKKRENQEIPEDQKRQNKTDNDPEFLGHSKSSSRKDVYSNTSLSQEIRKNLK